MRAAPWWDSDGRAGARCWQRRTSARAHPGLAAMSELAAEYAEFLGDLTSNNKGLINSLTMVAGENAADAGAVAGALEVCV